MPAEVTAAVVVKDRRALMGRCLDGLLAQAGVDFDVVVVDNGSTDGTFEMLTERAAAAPVPVRIERVTGSLGTARNAAARLASAPVVAFTDSDCVPDPGWLAAGLATLTPGVGAVQGRTLPAEPVTRRWAATQQIEAFTQLYEACNLFYRVQPLLAAGGFDEAIGFFGEDTAAGWRLRRAGWGAVYAPDAVVRHVVSYPGVGWQLRRGLQYAHWPTLVRAFPELRDVLYHRWFLRRRNAAFVAALAGGALVAARRPAGAVLAAPYLWLRRPDRGGPAGLADAGAGALYDAAVLAGLVIGSVRERTVVL